MAAVSPPRGGDRRGSVGSIPRTDPTRRSNRPRRAHDGSRRIVTLRHAVIQTFLVAAAEDTGAVEAALAAEGLRARVLRQRADDLPATDSRSYRALRNHASAWRAAEAASGPTLVVEADFVPVRGFGSLPLPFPAERLDSGLGWLYCCAPQLYSVSRDGFAGGFSTSTVAYCVTPGAARHLGKLADRYEGEVGRSRYWSWDSAIDGLLRRSGLRNYIPFRNYGEHGGDPNPEHAIAGLSATHRADVLWRELAFAPHYAAGSRHPSSTYLAVRSRARAKGVARLLAGRFLRPKVLRGSSVPGRLLRFALGRLLTARL